MGFWKSLREEMGHLRFWVFLSFGLIMLLAATIDEVALIEHSAHSTEHPPPPLWYESATVAAGLLRELGFATLIALALVVFVEHESRARQEQAVEKMLGVISKDVFEAALAARLPKELVRETFAAVLETNVIRDFQRTTLAFDEILKDDGTHSYNYIKITANNVYNIRNITDRRLDKVPIRLGFPKSPIPDYAKHVGPQEIYIGAKLTTHQIQEGYKDIEDGEEVFRYRWWVRLEPNEKVEIRTRYSVVKERSASDVWRSLFPTMDLHIDVTMNCDKLAFGVHALHRSEMEKTAGSGAKGFHSWHLAEPVLPHQGIVVWWKPVTPAAPLPAVQDPAGQGEQILPFQPPKGNVKEQ